MSRVQLAVSRIAEVPGVGSAYHSSVLVDGEEFYFSDTGLMCAPSRDGDCATPQRGDCSEVVEVFSHAVIGNLAEIFEMGTSHRSRDLEKVLGSRFLPGTYDLLRKNCNSFSDCALTYLLGKRLDPKFRQLDSLGLNVQSSLPSFLEAASLGQYHPNPAADGFDLEATVRTLANWSSPCPQAAQRRRNRLLSPTPKPPSSPVQLAADAYQAMDWLSDRAADSVLEALHPFDLLSDRAADGIVEALTPRPSEGDPSDSPPMELSAWRLAADGLLEALSPRPAEDVPCDPPPDIKICAPAAVSACYRAAEGIVEALSPRPAAPQPAEVVRSESPQDKKKLCVPTAASAWHRAADSVAEVLHPLDELSDRAAEGIVEALTPRPSTEVAPPALPPDAKTLSVPIPAAVSACYRAAEGLLEALSPRPTEGDPSDSEDDLFDSDVELDAAPIRRRCVPAPEPAS